MIELIGASAVAIIFLCGIFYSSYAVRKSMQPFKKRKNAERKKNNDQADRRSVSKNG